jgi:hypothetical protein
VKIRSVRTDARRRAFAVKTASGEFEFPWAQLDVRPTTADPVESVGPDPEIGNEGFTYRLASGAEGTVHIDHVLRLARDRDYLHHEHLYYLTNEARDALRESGRSQRSLGRQLGTSLAQIARLLDPTNTRKSVDQMIRFLGAMGKRVDMHVEDEPNRGQSPSPRSARRRGQSLGRAR